MSPHLRIVTVLSTQALVYCKPRDVHHVRSKYFQPLHCRSKIAPPLFSPIQLCLLSLLRADVYKIETSQQ